MRLLKPILLILVQLIALASLYGQPTKKESKFTSLLRDIEKIVKETKAVGVSVALIDNPLKDTDWASHEKLGEQE